MSVVKNIGTCSGKLLLAILKNDRNQFIRNLNSTSVRNYSLGPHRSRELFKEVTTISVQNLNGVPLIRQYSSDNNSHQRHNNNNGGDNENEREDEEKRYRRHDRLLFRNEPISEFPSFKKSVKNFFGLFFILKCYLDREFSWTEFAKESKQALQVRNWTRRYSECDLKWIYYFRWSPTNYPCVIWRA